jgi:hypothetical protein
VIVVRETGDRIAGVITAGLFAATFRISGAWSDTGRVDSLFLALTLIALAFGCRARGVRGGIVLGGLAFLAFMTKQTALVALLPALAYLAVTRHRVGIPALVTLAALLVASTALLDAATDGWYRYYVFSELVHQPWAQQVWISFWRQDILQRQWPLVILLVAGGVTLAHRPGIRPTLRSATMYYAVGAAGLVASAWGSRLHTGGYANVLMPAYAAIALLAGLTYAEVLGRRPNRGLSGVLLAGLLLQLGMLAYPLGAQIPTAADRVAGAQLIARLRTLRGPVLVLRHPWYATIAGKGAFAQSEAIGDVLRSRTPRVVSALRGALRCALDTDHVQAVVLDGPWDAHLFGAELSREFQRQPGVITPSRLYPPTDVRTSPTLLYLRVHPARLTCSQPS